MGVEIPKTSYSGAIRQISFGSANKVTMGGANSFPFHVFEGEMPNPPRIAMEVYDHPPEDWPEAALAPFKDVVDDPVKWAGKCIEEYGAEIICLQLKGLDPNGKDDPVEDAVATASRVAEAVEVPLIVWGCGNDEKDAEALKAICEACEGRGLMVGPVTENNYSRVGAAAIAYQHVVAAMTPIDINLAKQLNILLGNLGVPDDRIVIDPNSAALGYGIEYTYSVMERIRMAALLQEDERLAFPIICNMAREVWKVKEVGIPQQEDPKLGDPEERGIMMEAMTASLLLNAGADLLIMRHPEAIKRTRKLISDMMG